MNAILFKAGPVVLDFYEIPGDYRDHILLQLAVSEAILQWTYDGGTVETPNHSRIFRCK